MRVQLLAALLVTGTLAGCIGSDAGLEEQSAADLDLSQAIYELEEMIEEPLPVTSLDGKRLDTFMYRPDAPEGAQVPTILILSPYFSNWENPDARTDNIEDYHPRSSTRQLLEYFLPRGYAVVASSVRGTGYSEGCFSIGGPQESKDSVAVVEEIIAQPWSNGHVGVWGISYVGTTANDLLTEGHPAVKTVVPISAISDFYRYNFVNAVPINPQGYTFNFYYERDVAIVPPPDGSPDQVLNLVREEASCSHADTQGSQFESAATGDKTAYWQERDYNREVDGVSGSVFYVHGLQDWNVKPHHVLPWLDHLQDRVPTKVWLGQWAHNRPNYNTHEKEWSRGDWNETLLRWFDHWLKGVDTGILDEPMVDVQDDLGTWRHEERWPPEHAVDETLYLTTDGLAWEPGAGAAIWQDTGLVIPKPPTSGEPHYVLLESEPVEHDGWISGEPRLELTLTHTATQGTLAATLWRISPEDQWERINYAFLDLEHRESLEQAEPVEPGAPFTVEVAFFPQEDLIPKGHRLALTLSGNDSPLCYYDTVATFMCVPDGSHDDPGPLMQPVPSGGLTTVTLDEGARLVLPVVHDIEPFEPPLEFPEEAEESLK